MMNARRAARRDRPHRAPSRRHLLDRPYLQPVYDEPEFVVRNVWRLYGGWWDGNPATLKPAPERALAAELAALAGGAQRRALALRAARALLGGVRPSSGGGADPADEALRLAGHLAELAWLAAPADAGVARDQAPGVAPRGPDAATSTMASGVFRWAARESLAERPEND